MYNKNGDSSSELWAVVYEDGSIAFSRGGSSSKPKLMVYESETKAKRAMSSYWSKQVLKDRATIKKIYG